MGSDYVFWGLVFDCGFVTPETPSSFENGSHSIASFDLLGFSRHCFSNRHKSNRVYLKDYWFFVLSAWLCDLSKSEDLGMCANDYLRQGFFRVSAYWQDEKIRFGFGQVISGRSQNADLLRMGSFTGMSILTEDGSKTRRWFGSNHNVQYMKQGSEIGADKKRVL